MLWIMLITLMNIVWSIFWKGFVTSKNVESILISLLDKRRFFHLIFYPFIFNKVINIFRNIF